MTVPLTKPFIGDEEIAAATEAIRSGWVSQGPRVQEFEKSVAAYTGARHAIATTSCTTSLFVALKLLGIGEGDEVIVPSLSFIASANSIRHTGALPVFCDVERETLNIDPKLLEACITPRTRAILPVHQLGLPCDLDPLYACAKAHTLHILEDAACALGSTYKGRPIGREGHAAFSFHPRKLITTGEGGMILTDDGALAERARMFRAHGMATDDLKRHSASSVVIETYPLVGYNFRMTDVQAAIGIEQMRRLPDILARRRTLADRYREKLQSLSWLTLPVEPSYATFNYQSYAVTLTEDAPCTQRECMQALFDKGIASRRGVMAIHLEESYRDVAHGPLPVTEYIASHSIILPLYPQMTEAEQDMVIDVLRTIA